MADSVGDLQRQRDRLSKRLARERAARAEAEAIAEGAIRELSKTNRELQRFFDLGVHLHCTIDAELRFRELNLAWESALGYDVDELRGRKLTDFIHPDDVDITIGEAERLIAEGGSLVGFQHRLRHRDGRWLWISWSVRLADGIFYAAALDITAQRRAEAALHESEARMRAILDSAVDAILTIDEQGIIQALNPATEKVFGYREDELVGRNVSGLMHSPHRDRHDRYIRAYLETGVAKVIGVGRETMARRKDGTTIPIELSVGEVVVAGRRLFTGIIRDITQRKEALDRLEGSLLDLEKSRDDLLTTLDLLRVGTMVVDGTGRIAFANETWGTLANLEVREAIGKRWDEVIPVDRAGRDGMRAAMRGREQSRARLRQEWRVAEGRTRGVEVDIKDDPRDASGRIAFFYDVSEVEELRSRLAEATHGRMIGSSAPIREVYAQIAQVAEGDWTVLIEGETGVGKELVARAVHSASARKGGPFVAVNCAGLTDELLESRLFGHRKGAFTGAVADQQGLFEAAAGGTILLDEIGDISLKLQSALLRVLQEREVLRVGDSLARRVDVRIVAATNRDLEREVAKGRFRQDLLYRIRVARIAVPPLRERADDIPLLAAAFVEEQRLAAGKPTLQLDAAAMEGLRRHLWPGNVRELRSAIEYAVIQCRAGVIGLADLPPEVKASASLGPPSPSPTPARPRSTPPPAWPRAAPPPVLSDGPPPLDQAVDERQAILEALEWAEGNRARAARRLGISRATLYRRLRRLGVPSKSKAKGRGP